MATGAIRAAVAAIVVVAGGVAVAADPVLPAPRPAPTMVMWPLGFEQPDPYAVWRTLAVDRQGRFKPLVVPSFDGPRYVATWEPYPWAAEHQRNVRPMVANAATFDQPRPIIVEIMPEAAPATGWERMPYAEK
jgi:hypothetical protein